MYPTAIPYENERYPDRSAAGFVHFLAAKNGKEFLIQVAYSVAEEPAYEREFSPFNLTDNSRKKILITNDENDFSTSTVQHIKLRDFLLMEDLG